MRGFKKYHVPLRDIPTRKFDELKASFDLSVDWDGNVLYFRKKRSGVGSKMKDFSPRRYRRKKKKQSRMSRFWLRITRFLVWSLFFSILANFWISTQNAYADVDLTKYAPRVSLSAIEITEDEISDLCERHGMYFENDNCHLPPQSPAEVGRKAIEDVFGEWADEMLICMQSENGTLHPQRASNTNRNGTIDMGLMRVNSVHCFGRLKSQGFRSVSECERWLQNAENNAQTAKAIFDDREHGFTAWYGHTCRQFWHVKTKVD